MSAGTADAAPPELPAAGDAIGPYEVIRELGRGGMGAVYLARDTRLGRRVAIKFLHRPRSGSEQRFILEARATARCSHENIIVIHEVGEHHGHPFIVLEYLEGTPLGHLMGGGEPVSVARAVELVVPVVRALACAHDRGIVHRDLKPDNIFVTRSGTVKVLDFGIAKLVQEQLLPAGLASAAELGAADGAQTDDRTAGPPHSLDRTLRDERPRRRDAGASGEPLDRTAGPPHSLDRTAGPPHSLDRTIQDRSGDVAAGVASAGAASPIDAPVVAGVPDGATDPPPDPWRAQPSRVHATEKGTLVGTLPYMAPEQWLGAGVDHQADLWAVGIILFQMVAGRHPLAPGTGWQLGYAVTSDDPMPDLRAACPRSAGDDDRVGELAAVVARCLVKAKAARIASAQELLVLLEPLLPANSAARLAGDTPPYAGLHAFQESDAGRFFGRTREIAAALTRLRAQPLLGVVGASGVGKSSFVRAGLVPALTGSGEAWTIRTLRPGRQPMVALARLLAPLVDDRASEATTVAMDLDAHRAVAERLAAEPGWLGTALRARARRRSERILVFVDQFEELYTLGAEPEERLAFTACLHSVADDAASPLRLVLSVRSDFLDRVVEDERFMADLGRSLLFLAPPDRAGLRDALVEPAGMAGYRFESPATVDHMLDYLASTPGALPLLQFTAARLWDLRDRERKLLTEASYRAIGGIAGALASHADEVLDGLPAGSRPLARALILRLVTANRTRAVVPLSELAELSGDVRGPGHGPRPEVTRLVDRLVDARLLVVRGAAGGTAVELVHESLIHGWPLLARWLDESHDDAAFLAELRTAARQWRARGHAGGLLWRGEAADEAGRFASRYRGELTELERAYLHAVIAAATRAARRRRRVVAATIAVLSAMVVAAVIALVAIRDAERRATDQARIARDAERVASEQLAAVRAAQSARQRAEGVATTARQAEAAANRELRARNADLATALERADAAGDRARRAQRRAESNEAAALDAKRDVTRLNAELARKLAEERQRNRELRAKLRGYITGFDLATGEPGDLVIEPAFVPTGERSSGEPPEETAEGTTEETPDEE